MTCTFNPSTWDSGAEIVESMTDPLTNAIHDAMDSTLMVRAAQSAIELAIVNRVRDRVLDFARVQLAITGRLDDTGMRMRQTANNYRATEDHAEACASGGF